ncbi:MAG: nucleotidyltransferase domain-containing protein [Bacteroidota bacterium]
MQNARTEVLRLLRKKVGYSQIALAASIGKSQSYLSRLEQGKIELQDNVLNELLRALKVTKPAYLSLVKTHNFLKKVAQNATSDRPIGTRKTASTRKSRETLLKIVRDYFEKQAVKSVYVFGSVARDEHTPDSDLDIMIAFKDNYKATLFDLIGFKQDLSQLTDYEVDIVQEGTAYPHVQASFERDKIAVYG